MNKYNLDEKMERVKEILNDIVDIKETEVLPSRKKFTFNNGFYARVISIFVDIRDSTKLFTSKRKTSIAKIIRAFTSETIEILRRSHLLREIGVRGDCVYAIYATESFKTDYEVVKKAFCINEFIKKLNKLLQEKGMKNIVVGIGISTGKDLVIRSGKKYNGLKDLVWIGETVTLASKFSSIANKDGNRPIIMSAATHNNFLNIYNKKHQNHSIKKEFEEINSCYGRCYGCESLEIN